VVAATSLAADWARWDVGVDAQDELVAQTVYEFLRQSELKPALRANAAEPAVRRAWLRTTLRRLTFRLLRQRARHRARHASLAAAATVTHTDDPGAMAIAAADPNEPDELVSKLRHRLAGNAHALFALQVHRKETTVAEYARLHDLQESTAQKYFLAGNKALADALRQILI
jgi:hypothetical protein